MNEAKRKYLEIIERGATAHLVVGPDEQVLGVFETEAEAEEFSGAWTRAERSRPGRAETPPAQVRMSRRV